MRILANYRGLKAVTFNPEEQEVICEFQSIDGQEFKAVFPTNEVNIPNLALWMLGIPTTLAFPQLNALQRSWFDDIQMENDNGF